MPYKILFAQQRDDAVLQCRSAALKPFFSRERKDLSFLHSLPKLYSFTPSSFKTQLVFNTKPHIHQKCHRLVEEGIRNTNILTEEKKISLTNVFIRHWKKQLLPWETVLAHGIQTYILHVAHPAQNLKV